MSKLLLLASTWFGAAVLLLTGCAAQPPCPEPVHAEEIINPGHIKIIPWKWVEGMAKEEEYFEVVMSSDVEYYSMKLEAFDMEGNRIWRYVNDHLHHRKGAIYGIYRDPFNDLATQWTPLALHISWTTPQPAVVIDKPLPRRSAPKAKPTTEPKEEPPAKRRWMGVKKGGE